jgi:hypothetical protein
VLIWSAGIVFRLTVFPLDAQLSEDLYRYRWQGKLQAAGGNPYTEVPQAPQWEELRDETWPLVNRKDLPSAYGPLLELLYAGYYPLARILAADPARQAWLFKLPFALLELGVALALSRLLRLLGQPAGRILIYLWSPLAVVEFWAQGHNDTLAVLLVLLALTASLRGRHVWAFLWLTLAALAKFWPAVLFPFFLLRREDRAWKFRWKPALIAAPAAVIVCLPYLGGISNVRDLLEGFIGGWRNNDSLYGFIYDYAEKDFDRATELVQRILLFGLAALWAFQLPLLRAAQCAIALLLFLSANCFPWYLSWLLPFLAIFPNAALLLWTALVMLHYHVLIGYGILGVWQDSDEFRKLEYLPVYGLLAAGWIARFFVQRRLALPGWLSPKPRAAR